MAIEDIKGYQPHTPDKTTKVNMVKKLEANLGRFINELQAEYSKLIEDERGQMSSFAGAEATQKSLEKMKEYRIRKEQLEISITKLKECSMWACRAIFAPKEFY